MIKNNLNIKMSILPDYLEKKKLILVGEFYEKKNKKKKYKKRSNF
jgi:hypothetical protein